MFTIIASVGAGIISKRHIPDRRVEEVIRKRRILVAAYLNIRIWVKLLCDPSRYIVKLYSVQAALRAHFLGHNSEKISDTHRGFEDISALKSEFVKRGIYRRYDCRGSVVRRKHRAASRFIFVGCEQLFQFRIFRSPRRIIAVKYSRDTAPTDLLTEDFLLVGWSGTDLAFDLI